MSRQELTLDSTSLPGGGLLILRNWWIILCWMLAMLLGATGVGNLTYSPEYTASATLVIRMMGSDAYTSLSQTTQMTTVYSEIFQSSALRDLVSESFGEEVEGTISCSQISETNLLVLSATSPTPREAYFFLQSALRNYEQVAGYVFTNAALEIVQEPSVPETPSNASFLISHRWELTALSGVAAAGIILLIYLLRYTVKSASTASDLLDGSILGIIPYESKRGATGLKKLLHKQTGPGIPALLINFPLVSMDFAEAGRRAATRIESHLRHKGFQTLLVCSIEENEGKSTVAANIAIALAERRKKVLLLDGDLRKPAQYKIFDRSGQKKPSFSDVLAGTVPLNKAITRNEKAGFWELFQYGTVMQPGVLINSSQLEALLDELRNRMDYIVIDCPPVAAAADAELWMHHADTAALVVRQDTADVRVINDTVDLIWKSTGDFAGFILNAFRKEALRNSRGEYYGES